LIKSGDRRGVHDDDLDDDQIKQIRTAMAKMARTDPGLALAVLSALIDEFEILAKPPTLH
jgi:hypothetical protein